MAMETDFGFVGWCNTDNHDKVWGYFYRPTPHLDENSIWGKKFGWNVVIFWGGRGHAMRFKADVSGHELDKLQRSKLKKGYQRIRPETLYSIWPTFDEEMKQKLSFELLVGNVK
jgi:hypothetical protein